MPTFDRWRSAVHSYNIRQMALRRAQLLHQMVGQYVHPTYSWSFTDCFVRGCLGKVPMFVGIGTVTEGQVGAIYRLPHTQLIILDHLIKGKYICLQKTKWYEHTRPLIATILWGSRTSENQHCLSLSPPPFPSMASETSCLSPCFPLPITSNDPTTLKFTRDKDELFCPCCHSSVRLSV